MTRSENDAAWEAHLAQLDARRRRKPSRSGSAIARRGELGIIRRELPASINSLGDRQIMIRASTASLGRDGLSVESRGISLAAYRSNPIVLWAHDPQFPVAKAASISIVGDALEALVEFAPEGSSVKADEVCALTKSGIISGISCGLDKLETEPIDPSNRRAGLRVVRCELVEISLVSIPALPDAIVIGRAFGRRAGDVDAAAGHFHRACELVDEAARHLYDATAAHRRGDHDGVAAAHARLHRCIEGAQRALRAAAGAADIAAVHQVQTSGGVDTGGGTSSSGAGRQAPSYRSAPEAAHAMREQILQDALSRAMAYRPLTDYSERQRDLAALGPRR